MIKDDKFPLIIEEFIGKTVELCRNLPRDREDKETIDTKYTEICINASNFMTKEFKNIDTNDMYEFIAVYITTFYNYMIKYSKKSNVHLGYLFQSALRKYRDILYCIENNDLESGLILFKTLYENIIVLEFLAFHPECIELYSKYSQYTLYKRLTNKVTEIKDNKIIELKNIIKEIEKEFGHDIKMEYGWAKSVIKKEILTSKDIFYCTFDKNIEIIDMMNEIVSDLITSNVSELERFRLVGDNYFNLLLNKCLEVFGIQFLIKSFYDIFCDNNYFEANIFLKISEISLDKWGYKFNIR